MFDFIDTNLEGLLRIRSKRFGDERGVFTKLFHEPTFAARGLVVNFPELYYSSSRRDVIRGLHFQVPPFEHAKIVSCQAGRAIDVVVDIRVKSTSYGSVFTTELDGDIPEALYIPAGFAHGFQAIEDHTVMTYLVSSVHSSAHDAGILWSSVGAKWTAAAPIVSVRDRGFPMLAGFESPF